MSTLIAHQHRAWCNRQLLHACRPLSAEQLHAPFEITGCGGNKTAVVRPRQGSTPASTA
jgi:hypothetical protein